ncbi:MAG: SAM-dependent methyltransferase [Chloroflexota bacterium]
MGTPQTSTSHQVLAELIRSRGPITFARYMAFVLYDPDYGYYTAGRPRVGDRGDYYTSPAVHPVFGHLLARQAADVWARLGRPEQFTVVDLGGGQGYLAVSLLGGLRRDWPGLFHRTRYFLVDFEPNLRAAHRRLAAEPGDLVARVELVSDLPAEPFAGLVVANEFFDALPFHVVMNRGGQLREIYVGWRDGLVEVEGELSDPRLLAYFDRVGVGPAEGARAEVCLEGPEWVRRVGRILEAGLFLIIDYGYPAAELYSAKFPRGTLMCYHRGTYHDDPYRFPGEQDITAHVDFTALVLAGGEVGLGVLGLTTQAHFLRRLGIEDYIRALDRATFDDPESHSRNLALIRSLIKPGGLGSFKVLCLGRGVGRELWGLTGVRPEGLG